VVSIDDNPTERELEKQYLPMIETPDFQYPLSPLPSFSKDLLKSNSEY
jgi:hypothetical protein